MNLYAIRRRGGWSSPEALQASAARSAQVGDDEMSDDIRWIRSYVVHEPDGSLGTVLKPTLRSTARGGKHARRGFASFTNTSRASRPSWRRRAPPKSASLGAGSRFSWSACCSSRDSRSTWAKISEQVVAATSEAEDEHESLVHRAKLAGLEPPSRSAKALRIDDGRLLDEDACFLPCEGDRRTEARRARARRGRRDEHRAQVEKLVRLDDDRIVSAAVLMSASTTRGWQPKDLAADHFNPERTARARPFAPG
jgi:hypothetical protein